ncbi:ABC transporter permease, partial [Actinoplanes sp. NPDC051633]|uniref:ABC transporter permease n=1 Tax=Actinoplanes sp. NPDC051633 TaxID=3155670 RepID=UPI0034439038
PVWPELLSRLPVTLSLAIGAAILWLLFGLTTGVISALRRGSMLDRAAMGVSLAGVSLPIFFTGMIALTLFSYKLGWTAPGGTYTPIEENPGKWAYALLLPWLVLALQFSAQYARLTRAGMLETMGEDYIRTARAKGLPERDVTVRHGLRAALTPILTIFGLDFGILLGGAVLTESVFSLPGMGKYAIDAITNNDLPKVLGVVMMAAFFVVIANLVVDLLYAVVDPRVRLGS